MISVNVTNVMLKVKQTLFKLFCKQLSINMGPLIKDVQLNLSISEVNRNIVRCKVVRRINCLY